MKFFPKLTGVVLSAAILSQSVPFVYAAEDSDIQIKRPEGYTVTEVTTDNGLVEPVTEDDPSYLKYLENNMQNRVRTMSALWGAESLTHQSRFNGISKVYGIDVSYYQGNIDWTKVKNSGVEFVIIRVGYRGYGKSGTLVEDPRFKTYLDGATKAGLKVGVYFYTQAINTEEAVAEANFVLDRIKEYNLQMPVYYDIESVDYDTGRLDSAGLSKAQKTALCNAFCDTIIKSGYSAGVYANYTWLNYYIDGAALGQKYPIWLAHYTKNTNYDGRMDMWQYSGSGTVSGIPAYTDVNVWYADEQPLWVSDLISVSNTTSSNTIAWNPSSDATGYEVWQWSGTGDKYNLIGTTTESVFTNSGKSSGTMRKYKVRAYSDASGQRVYGSFSNILATCTLPDPISWIGAYASGTSVTLDWSAVSKATDYLVEHYENGAWKTINSTTNLSYTVSGITESGTNYFRVMPRRYYGGNYYYGDCTYVNAVVADIPNKVTGLYSVSNTSSSNTLSWNAVANATGYEVYQWTGKNDDYAYLGSVKSTSFTNSGKSSGTMRKYKVRAFNDSTGECVTGAYSDVMSTCTLPANVSFTVCSTNVNSVTLNWNKVSKANSYQVDMYSNGTWKTLGTTSKKTYTVGALSDGGTYYFRVRAIRNYNGAAYCGNYSEKTITISSANAPTSLKSKSNTTSSNTFTWKAASGAAGYTITQWTGKGDNYKKLGNTTSLTYTNSKKAAGTMYRYRVQAYYVSDNVIQYSKPVELTVCTLPGSVSIKSAKRSGSTVKFTWGKVSKATSYEVYIKSGSKWKKLTTTSKTSYTAKGLNRYKSYKFRIRARRNYKGTIYYGKYTNKTVK